MKITVIITACFILTAGISYAAAADDRGNRDASSSEETGNPRDKKADQSKDDSFDSSRSRGNMDSGRDKMEKELRADVIKRFDKDGDGKLNKEELEALKRAMETERENRGM